MLSEKEDPTLTHVLSENAYKAVFDQKGTHALSPLLKGPLACLVFPVVSPAHLATALSMLAPSPPQYPAPTRRGSPNFYDPSVQSGLPKLMLLGARIEGKVFDVEGVQWVGSIDGGIDGLRSQLVQMLQGFGVSLASTLESASRNVYFTLEGRRNMLEEESKSKDAGAEGSEKQS